MQSLCTRANCLGHVHGADIAEALRKLRGVFQPCDGESLYHFRALLDGVNVMSLDC